jgi:hypothetical protein
MTVGDWSKTGEAVVETAAPSIFFLYLELLEQVHASIRPALRRRCG